MKLNKDQIATIDDYLKKNGVKYWDVRLEMIDHLASKLEEKPRLVLDDKLLKDEFGNILDLNTLVNIKKRFIGKKYRNLIFNEIKNFFKSFKNIAVVIVIILLEYTLYLNFANKTFIRFNVILFGISLIIPFYYITKYYIRKNRSYNLEAAASYLALHGSSFIFISFIIKSNLPISISYSIFIAYLLLSFIWAFAGFKIYHKTEQEYNQLYKELQLL